MSPLAFTADAMYDFARYDIRKNGQFPFECMYSHSVPVSNSVVTGWKQKVVRLLRVQISSNEKMSFVIQCPRISFM